MGLDLAPLPPGCTFLNFTASHDGIGLRPLEGLVPDDEVKGMLEAMRDRGGYISTRRNSDGTDVPYELNISYFDAFRSTVPGESQWHIPAFLVSQIVALTLKGIPAVYVHSLTATPNDTLGVELTGMTRSINRRKWDRAELEGLIANHASETGRVFATYRDLLDVRRQQPALHPDAAQHVLGLENGLFGVLRVAPDHGQRILALFNFTPRARPVDESSLPLELSGCHELLGLSSCALGEQGLTLPPYAACWFSDRPAGGGPPGNLGP
jgi:sucrose phosphorylase